MAPTPSGSAANASYSGCRTTRAARSWLPRWRRHARVERSGLAPVASSRRDGGRQRETMARDIPHIAVFVARALFQVDGPVGRDLEHRGGACPVGDAGDEGSREPALELEPHARVGKFLVGRALAIGEHIEEP